ncbi:uncharacterized protein LOC107606194 [Arachis ipaensis]|uniref:uncharacterized protein LOC107606194 n=1 Tax=Arachis ipaensis TaxID=130454 RepID=UPI0007AFD50A|nr:uncharacterized protein LOC107606194 [Arachis ipaensis]
MDNHSASLRTPKYKARLPYPQKLHKTEKDEQFTKFRDILKTLEIKIPFDEALEQIPSCAKFMKDIMSHKREWKEAGTIFLTKECSAVIQRNLPEKLQDPGSFVIPYTLGETYIRTALCDLGARINLMPSSLMNKLGIQEPMPTRICLQLADGSIKIPSGVVEDMIVRVGPFAYLIDFVILDMKENRNASIILCRPFLATGGTIIDVRKGEVTLRVDKDEFTFNAVKAIQHPDPPRGMHKNQCYRTPG